VRVHPLGRTSMAPAIPTCSHHGTVHFVTPKPVLPTSILVSGGYSREEKLVFAICQDGQAWKYCQALLSGPHDNASLSSTAKILPWLHFCRSASPLVMVVTKHLFVHPQVRLHLMESAPVKNGTLGASGSVVTG